MAAWEIVDKMDDGVTVHGRVYTYRMRKQGEGGSVEYLKTNQPTLNQLERWRGPDGLDDERRLIEGAITGVFAHFCTPREAGGPRLVDDLCFLVGVRDNSDPTMASWSRTQLLDESSAWTGPTGCCHFREGTPACTGCRAHPLSERGLVLSR